jgi:Domain of unknown function (DUF4281)
MIPNLFQLAGLGIIGWVLLIFFPTWRPTRALADSAFFPTFIAILYAFGVGALIMENGIGFVADFGSVEGVTRLLAQPQIAIVAWIHILAFDQAIGLWIYRENMRHCYVRLPLQSAILFLTLMFGPLGYLTFVLVRVGRMGTGAFREDVKPAPRSIDDVVPTVGSILDAYREERTVASVALGGVVLGILMLILIALRGSASVPPEGDLMKPATFDVAVGLFILSLVPWLPAAFGETGRCRWRFWMTLLLIYAFGIETVQQLRGIDPRFSQAEPVSQLFGSLFFISALGIMALSIAVAARAFEMPTTGRRGLLVLAARWASVSMLIGFLAGFYLSANQGRFVGEAGNLLPLHATGFHAVQAIPLVGLLFAWSAASTANARRWVHAAGAAWALACVALWWQTALGRAVTDFSGAGTLAVIFLGIWALAALRAVMAWAMTRHVVPAQSA